MRKISCVILDDEPLAIVLLENYASKIAQLDVVLATTDAFKVVEFLQKNKVDLIFIDIQMPEISGIQMMEMFNKDTHFIITSAYPSYALKSYEFRVIDYLLKPISFDKFHKAITKFLAFSTENTQRILFVKADGKQIRLDPDQIVFIEGLSDYIRIHLAMERLIVHETLKDFIQKLPSKKFMRIHKSYIIQLDKIRAIEGNSIRHELGLIPVGETYKNQLKLWIENQ
ncbi:LytR/AlgR family response regulator transcription factor [Flavobacterium sp.]|jgi:DNA-binding LytR/AlgR family response regulator|uniref:LytR/AlgR family response regulator transcription factor n=1 Tax=Flavobacterium sp. TaxID=239 RepID=UPI0037BFFCDC